MFGEWLGVRKDLQDNGIFPTASYVTDILGNTTGASRKVLYVGQVNASVILDYDKILKIPGLSMVVNGSWGTGGGLTSRIGNLV